MNKYVSAHIHPFKPVDLTPKEPKKRKAKPTKEKNKDVLYVQLDRALYGCVQSALLWYELFSSTLVNMGFEINPYDRCVANKVIKGKQCTIAWYVDDNIVTHEDPEVVTEVIDLIKTLLRSRNFCLLPG